MKIRLIIVLLVLFGLCIFFITGYSQKTEIIHREIEKEEGGSRIKVSADIAVTTDCGDILCFEEKFAKCEPATITLKLTNNLIYYYEIVGPKEGLCELKSKFLANPNPEWVGKEMTCGYDNSKKFEIAVEDMSNCQGPLYDIMIGRATINNNAETEIVITFREDDFFKKISPEFQYQGPGSIKEKGIRRLGNEDLTKFHLVCHHIPKNETYESGGEYDNPKYDILRIKGSYWFEETNIINVEIEIDSEIEGVIRIKGVMLDNKNDQKYKFKKGIQHFKTGGKLLL